MAYSVVLTPFFCFIDRFHRALFYIKKKRFQFLTEPNGLFDVL